mmetsp:Transcript_46434/g.93726  ORF Transcript_46434/g.93726 Transcript_46434/m.93726 type:complete len:239 (-) Transcript_46434:420-1136(-)
MYLFVHLELGLAISKSQGRYRLCGGCKWQGKAGRQSHGGGQFGRRRGRSTRRGCGSGRGSVGRRHRELRGIGRGGVRSRCLAAVGGQVHGGAVAEHLEHLHGGPPAWRRSGGQAGGEEGGGHAGGSPRDPGGVVGVGQARRGVGCQRVGGGGGRGIGLELVGFFGRAALRLTLRRLPAGDPVVVVEAAAVAVLDGILVVLPRCLLFFDERPEVYLLAVDADLHHPLLVLAVPRNSHEL